MALKLEFDSKEMLMGVPELRMPSLRMVTRPQAELVLFRILFSRGFRHGVKRVKGVFVGQVWLVGKDLFVDMLAKRLQHGEEDASI